MITAMPWQAGDKILITRGEWGGNVAMLHQLQQRAGVVLEEIPCDVHGTLDLEGLQRKLAADPRIKLVALTWVHHLPRRRFGSNLRTIWCDLHD